MYLFLNNAHVVRNVAWVFPGFGVSRTVADSHPIVSRVVRAYIAKIHFQSFQNMAAIPASKGPRKEDTAFKIALRSGCLQSVRKGR